MSEQKIVSLMVGDHRKIEKLLNELEDNAKIDYETMRKSFLKFEWNLEKHLFVEEKVIFLSYNPQDIVDGYKMLPVLTKQHNVILNTLNSWRKDVRNKKIITNVSGFREFLIKHKNFEEQEVYPRLEESLDDAQKNEMVNRINEIIVK